MHTDKYNTYSPDSEPIHMVANFEEGRTSDGTLFLRTVDRPTCDGDIKACIHVALINRDLLVKTSGSFSLNPGTVAIQCMGLAHTVKVSRASPMAAASITLTWVGG